MLLLKPQWHPSIPYFRVMCLIGVFYPISAIAYNVLKVRSNGRIILRLEIIKKVIMTIILATTIPISTMAIAWGLVVASACEMILNVGSALRFTKLSVRKLLGTLLPIVLLTAAMYAATLTVEHFTIGMNTLSHLLIAIATGSATYIAGAYIFRTEAMTESIAIIQRFVKR